MQKANIKLDQMLAIKITLSTFQVDNSLNYFTLSKREWNISNNYAVLLGTHILFLFWLQSEIHEDDVKRNF